MSDSPEITQARATLAAATATRDGAARLILDEIAQHEAAIAAARRERETLDAPYIAAREALATLLRAEWPVVPRADIKALAIAAGPEGLEVVSHRDWLTGTPGDTITRATCTGEKAPLLFTDPRFVTAAPLMHVRRAVRQSIDPTIDPTAPQAQNPEGVKSDSEGSASSTSATLATTAQPTPAATEATTEHPTPASTEEEGPP